LATLGLQLIAVTVTKDMITMSNTSLVNNDHTHTLDYTPEGQITNITLTPSGTISSSFSGVEHSHTFSTTSANTDVTISASQTTIKSILSVGTLPTATLNPGTLPTCEYIAPVLTHKDPEITTSVSAGCLAIGLSAGEGTLTNGSIKFNQGALPSLEFNAGTLPTVEDVIVAKGDHKHSYNTISAINNTTATGTVSSTFTGTPIEHTHNFNGTQTNVETSKVK
jgi:YD repeat-containing protein